MNCRDCNTVLGDKFVKYSILKGGLELLEGVCFQCAEGKYNDYKKSDGRVRDFCEKCGEKFLQEDLTEVMIKKVKTLVCPRCSEDY